ncbi:hypothetical protein ACW0JT_19210 [Arthrobacter sp. SA17]
MSPETLIAAGSLLVAVIALVVAWLAFRHDRRNSQPKDPWKLTKLDNGLWELERLAQEEVWITHLLNFHGGEVIPVNGAGLPVFTFTAGRRMLLRFEPHIPGTELTVFSRPATNQELRDKLNIAPEYNTPEGMKTPVWSAHHY